MRARINILSSLCLMLLTYYCRFASMRRTPTAFEVWNTSNTLAKSSHLQIRFEELYSCNISGQELHLTAVNIHPYTSATNALDAKITFTRRLEALGKSTFQIFKCNDGSDHCDPFQTWKFADNACSLFYVKNTVFTPMFSNVHPPLLCPLRTQDYIMTNGSLDPKVIEKFPPIPLDNIKWKVRIDGFYPGTDKIHSCFWLAFRLKRVY